MCSIIGSFNKDKLKELYDLNAYRGTLSYSLTTFECKADVRLGTLFQDKGEMPKHLIDNHPNINNCYIVAHSQAPTTESKNIHPAVYGDSLLWHNGIVKQKELSAGTWDTVWLLENVLNYDWGWLSNVDGTFACVMYRQGELYTFRNEISPLFIDNELNISSTKFEESESIKPNVVFKIDLQNKKLLPVAYFTTKENPYYIPELT